MSMSLSGEYLLDSPCVWIGTSSETGFGKMRTVFAPLTSATEPTRTSLHLRGKRLASLAPRPLDRQILKRAVPGADGELRFEIPTSQPGFFQLLAARMAVLSRMGLATPEGKGWNLRADYLQILKTMQQARDRQKMLHQYGILLSDPRLPTVRPLMPRLPSRAGPGSGTWGRRGSRRMGRRRSNWQPA